MWFKYLIVFKLWSTAIDCQQFISRISTRPFNVQWLWATNSGQRTTVKPCLHDTTGWMFVYMMMMQPVVPLVWELVGQLSVSCIQTFNRLSNRLFNRLYGLITAVEQPAASCKQIFNWLSNRMNVCLHDAASCSTGWPCKRVINMTEITNTQRQ